VSGARRALVLSRSCPPDVGGYQRQLSLVLPRLVGRGVQVRAVGARRTAATGRSGWPGVRTVVLPVAGRPRAVQAAADLVLGVLALGLGVVGRLRRRGPEVLLLVSPTMRGARLVARAWRRAVGPVVARYPGSGGLARSGLAAVPGVRHVVLSPEQQAEAAGLGVAAELVENAVELGPAPPADRCFGRFVVVGRLIPTKRVDLALAAWAAVADRLPGWRLEVVGSGQGGRDDVEAALRAAAEGIPRVRFLGEVADGREHVLGDAVVVHCSTVEGVPNTLLEAMALGAPVVAETAALERWFGAAPPHVPWDGVSVESLATVLDQAARDPAGLAATASAAWEVAGARWSPEAAEARWDAVLR
jgi:glycosyltransferase involved in cell wall biosynthesis